MQLVFLVPTGGLPMGKRFSKVGDRFESHPFTMPRDLSTVAEEANSLDSFTATLRTHAAQDHALLRGVPSRPLENESRAGLVPAAQESEWLLIDIDGAPGYENDIDGWIRDHLPAEFHDVGYVLQYSASYGIKTDKGLSAHLYFLLDKPLNCGYQNLYLKDLNFEQPKLREKLDLSKSQNSLTYSLDVGVNIPSKLILITPPMLPEDVPDPVEERILAVHKGSERLALSLDNVNRTLIDEKAAKAFAELREVAGLPKFNGKTKKAGKVEYLTNPDPITVTAVKEDRGFCYMNFNGGDSWGYFTPLNHPVFVFNFKGEPVFRLEDVAPELSTELKDRLANNPLTKDAERIHVVARANDSDLYWNITYNVAADAFEKKSVTNSRTKLLDFFKQHDMPEPDFIPDWDIEFQPGTDELFDASRKFVNLYEPPELIRTARITNGVSLPFNCHKIINHALGGDKEVFEHFLNWAAAIIQYRIKTNVAWIVHGEEGTGKGILFTELLRPLVGLDYSAQKTVGNMEDRFNSWINTCLLLNINESSIGQAANEEKLRNEIKNMITEPTLSSRAMGVAQREIMSFVNIMITSNHADAWGLSSAEDRRFNVAARQEEKFPAPGEEGMRRIRSELPDLAGYFMSYKVDIDQARTPLHNEHKAIMARASMNSIDQFFDALTHGRLEHFLHYLYEKPDLSVIALADGYRNMVSDWTRDCLLERTSTVQVSAIKDAYQFLLGVTMPAGKFSRMLQARNVHVEQTDVGNKPIAAARIAWKASPELIKRYTRTDPTFEKKLHDAKTA